MRYGQLPLLLGTLTLLSIAAHAATYQLPAALGTAGPFVNCSGAGGTYSCTGSIDFGNDNAVVINVTTAMTLTIAESLTAKNNFSVVQTPAAPPVLLTIVATNGSVDIKNNLTVTANISAPKGTINLGNNGTVIGSLDAKTINAGSGTVVNGTCTPSHPACLGTVTGPNHIRVYLNNNSGALTCAPRAVDAIACADATCASRYASSVAVTLSPGGVAATIPAGGTGTPTIAQTTTGTTGITLAASAPATSGTPALQCYSGTVGAPGNDITAVCNVEFSSAGFFVSVPNHRSCEVQSLTVTAAKTDDQTLKCVPAFDGGAARTIKLRFSYSDPGTGTLAPTVGSANPPPTALATGSDASLAMSFTAGEATTNFQYQDAGSLKVFASYTGSAATGDAGLAMATAPLPAFVVAPASFQFSGIPAAPLTAGKAFNATVTAMNGCATPAATQNFGQEAASAAVTITSLNPDPGLGNATAIDVSRTAGGGAGTTVFSNGAASTDLTWNEVGKIDLKADLANYLGASPALAVTGSRTGVGPFRPAYFDTLVTPGCSGAFTYAGLTGTPSLAGQPFTVAVKAKRHDGNSNDNTNTANYAGATWARAVTLSKADASVAGTLANASLAATDFSAGIGSRADVSYGFADKLTAPVTLAVRSVDTDGATSSGHTEGTTQVRSGRLRLSNAFGSRNAALAMPVQALFWSGMTWVPNNADGCTSLAANAFARSGELSSTTAAPVALSAGVGNLMLNAGGDSGSVDVAANLGATANDQSCLTVHDASTPANLPWLRSRNGSCEATYDRDPAARATFGIYSETRRSIHVREGY